MTRRRIVGIAITAAAYFATGWLGLRLAVPPGYATAIWPPSGIALSAMLVGGYGLWPGVALGSFLINIGVGFEAGTAAALVRSLVIPAAIAGGASLEAVVGAALVRRFAGFPNDFASPGQVVRFLLLGGPAGCLINATLSIGVLFAAGRIQAPNLSFSWATWWAGDTIGVAVIAPPVIAWFSRRQPVWEDRWRPLAIGLGASLAATVALASLAASHERADAVRAFEESATALAADLEIVVGSDFNAVGATEAFLEAPHAPSRVEFRRFAATIRGQAPDIQALEWIPRLPASRRESFERQAQSEGVLNFEITERSNGKLVRASDRTEYYPVAYVEPLGGNETAIDFDLASNPIRLAALVAARDGGATTISGPVKLLQGQLGFLVIMPVYTVRPAPDSIEPRRRDLSGFALGVFRFSDLARLAEQHRNPSGVDYWLLDTTGGDDRVLYANTTRQPTSVRLDHTGLLGGMASIGAAEAIGAGGQRWVLETAATQTFLARYRPQTSWALLVVGLVVTGLVGCFILVLTGRERELRLLFVHNPEPMWTFDQETLRFVEVNDAAIAHYGYSREEFRSMRITDIRPAEDVRQLERLTAIPAGSRSSGEWRHRLKDGRLIDVEVSAHGLSLSNRRLALVVSHDISARKRLEERFRRVVESGPNAMVMINADGRIELVNAQAERIFGYSRDELLGQPAAMLAPDRFRRYHPELRDSFFGDPRSWPMGAGCVLYGLRKDGSEFPVEIGLNPIETDEGPMVLSAIVDISDRKHKEESIQAALKEKDILLGEIHHRVKNNLQVIHSLLDLQSAKVNDETALQLLKESRNRIRSISLIHQTLYESKDFARVDFRSFIDTLVPTLVSSYSADPSRITFEIDAAEVSFPINAAIPCGLIVNELISNALKHAFPGRRHGEIRIRLAKGQNDRVELSVSDNGVGIPEGLDLANATTLGLQLVRLLADQLAAEIVMQRANPTRFVLHIAVEQ